jgi:cytochrome b subunit of formate dehydrogenase
VRKTTINYLIFLAQAIAAFLLGVSALILWHFVPRGYLESRELWVDIHKWTGVALAVFVFIHIVLHWRWLVQMTRRYLTNIWNTVMQAGKTKVNEEVD